MEYGKSQLFPKRARFKYQLYHFLAGNLRKVTYYHFNFLQNVVFNTCLASLLWGLKEMYLKKLADDCLAQRNNSSTYWKQMKWHVFINIRHHLCRVLDKENWGVVTSDLQDLKPALHTLPLFGQSRAFNSGIIIQQEFVFLNMVRKSFSHVK